MEGHREYSPVMSVVVGCIATVTLLVSSIEAHASSGVRLASTPAGWGSPGDEQGAAVALSGDTIAVGAPLADFDGIQDAGLVAIHRHVGGAWQLESVLEADNAAVNGRFGASLALEGDLLVVAAAGGASTTLHTFERTGSSWMRVDRFTRQGIDSGMPRIALSGSTLAMHGGVVFVRSGNGWSLQAELADHAIDAGESPQQTIALDGDRLAMATYVAAGAALDFHAYVFSRSGSTWTREMKLARGSYPISWQREVALSGSTFVTDAGFLGHEMWIREQASWTSQGFVDVVSSAPYSGKVALDGDRAVIGSPEDSIPGAPLAGSVHVYERSGTTWSRSARLTGPLVPDGAQRFGSAVALEGDRAVVGAVGGVTDAGQSGSASVMQNVGGTWSLGQTLSLGNAHAMESFGNSAALSGDVALLGAPTSPLPMRNKGAAYLFERGAGGWVELNRLVPDASANGMFGVSTAVIDGIAFVGSVRDELGGSVYIYERHGDAWSRTARLASSTSSGMIEFGRSIAAQQGWLAVGNSHGSSTEAGRVVLFDRQASDWIEHATLQASDATPWDGFGHAASMSDDVLLVGAPFARVGIEERAGAAYVFRRSGSTWSQETKLVGSQPSAERRLGSAVTVRGERLALGSPDASAGSAGTGRVDLYSFTGSTWALDASLHAPPGHTANAHGFGTSVALVADDVVAVGAPGQAGLAGRTYVYRHDASAGSWSLVSVYAGSFTPGPSAPGADGFGTAVAGEGTTLMVGSPRDGHRGAGYVYGTGDRILLDGFDPI